MKTSYILTVSVLAAFCFCLSTSQMMMRKNKKRGKRMRCGMMQNMQGMEKNITALWEKVNMLSVPVHVHVHGASTESGDVTVMADHTRDVEEHHHHHSMEKHGHHHAKDKHGHDHDKGKGHHHHHDSEGEEKEGGEVEEEKNPNIMWNPRDRTDKMSRLRKGAATGGRHHKRPRRMRTMNDEEESDDKDEGEESEDSSSEEDEEDDDDRVTRVGPNIHIHLNMADSRHSTHATGHAHRDHEHGFAGHVYPADEYVYAKCDMLPNTAFSSQHKVRGSIFFRQKPGHDLEIKLDLYGFNPRDRRGRPSQSGSTHGFHLHEFGDYSNGCNSFGGHYNPHKVLHGGPESHQRHVGDWGNIEADRRGVAKASMTVTESTLFGPYSLVGRGVVVHDGPDDHGEGDSEASKASGNAGGRIACCIIGWTGGMW
ncbi:sarcoplasmic reticulum histidine-rich calcium-binding protein isoform X2 [Aplysia californica]|uniref:Superoxide dismutase [Cu-Zn] n=1 Tax=Aplysia californica TaxID=6500 RepID=A0ABM0JRD6_APLCA|nr:sarcoplasmic reticulum histidine-rich calcium-binding protein isoform X2 [Aplysia californica]